MVAYKACLLVIMFIILVDVYAAPAKTKRPTLKPSKAQKKPSTKPSKRPTAKPTGYPSALPTSIPSGIPSALPSSYPTLAPSSVPTSKPTPTPTAIPSNPPPTYKPSYSKEVHIRDMNTLTTQGASIGIALMSVFGGLFAGFFVYKTLINSAPEGRLLVGDQDNEV
jgi:hypothetical protein